MSRQKTINIRLSDIEHQALKKYAESIDMPMSEVLRDYVKTLIVNFGGVELNEINRDSSWRWNIMA